MYRNVLVPTDGSEGASRGLDHALELAAAVDATVHLLFVVDERRFHTPAFGSDELAVEAVEERGLDVLEEAEGRCASAGVPAVTVCRRGYPHREILDYVEQNDVDAVVMGRHGTAAHGYPHLGSSTERVIREGRVPVIPV